jgi:hypothetical protein
MNVTLVKALVALVPACMLFSGSVALSLRARTVWSLLQVLGAGCLVVVVLAHVAEALHLFPWMRWGDNDTVGHYLDLSSAVLGGTLFPLGYLMHALRGRGNGTPRSVAIHEDIQSPLVPRRATSLHPIFIRNLTGRD